MPLVYEGCDEYVRFRQFRDSVLFIRGSTQIIERCMARHEEMKLRHESVCDVQEMSQHTHSGERDQVHSDFPQVTLEQDHNVYSQDS